MARAPICAGLDTAKSGALYGRTELARPPADQCGAGGDGQQDGPGGLGHCSAEAKPIRADRRPPNAELESRKHYCEGDDDVMAKQGPTGIGSNPRHCPSLELDSLTGRRSFGFHQGQRSTTVLQRKGRIDDCKPNPPF